MCQCNGRVGGTENLPRREFEQVAWGANEKLIPIGGGVTGAKREGKRR